MLHERVEDEELQGTEQRNQRGRRNSAVSKEGVREEGRQRGANRWG